MSIVLLRKLYFGRDLKLTRNQVINDKPDSAKEADHGEKGWFFLEGGINCQYFTKQDSRADSHEKKSPF